MKKRMGKPLLRKLVCLAALLATGTTYAQTTVQTGTAAPGARYSLRQCIDIALQNNLDVKQSELNVQGSDLQLRQAKLNRYPNLSAFASQSLSSGRNINPGTNAFVDQAVNSNNYQIATSFTVFNGFALQNTVKQNDLLLQSNQQNLLATQNNVSLTVAQNYLNVLTYEEQLDIARRQVETSRAQAERSQRLVNAGTLAEANLYDLRAQVANDELAVVNAQNNLDLAKVALLQTMNLPSGPGANGFNIERLELGDPTVETYPSTVQQVYEASLQFLPDVKAAELRVRSDAVGVTVARGGLYPTLTLNGFISTLYSNVGLQQRFDNGVQKIPQVVTINGVQQEIFIDQPQYRYENYSYIQQLNNNLNRGLSLNLNIPIFNRNLAKNRITNAIIVQKSDEIAADNVRLTIRQNIETAYTNMLAGANRYRATLVQVESLEKAFQAAESRFNVGAINSVDYNLAKTNLDRARANLVQAKYDYVFRTKILDFYQNKPLSF